MAIKKISLYLLVLPIALVLVIPGVSAIACNMVNPYVQNCIIGDCTGQNSCEMIYQQGQYSCACRPSFGQCASSYPTCNLNGCYWGDTCMNSGPMCQCESCQTTRIDCTDTDNGLDYYTAGSATDHQFDCNGKVKTTTLTDTCHPDFGYLNEAFCNNSQAFTIGPIYCEHVCVDGLCACEGGIKPNQCDTNNKPHYCENDNIVNRCNICGCPAGTPYCQGDGTCSAYRNCGTGTTHNTCTYNKPMFCYDGVLSYQCDVCGCPPNKPTCLENGHCTFYE